MSSSLLILLLYSIVEVNAVNSFWCPPEKSDKSLEYDMDQTLRILWENQLQKSFICTSASWHRFKTVHWAYFSSGSNMLISL